MFTGEQKREYSRQWVARRRAEFFADKVCVICGSRDRLELNHIDPAKKTSHKIWSWTQAKREREIKKCDVRCHQCHLAYTREQRRAHIKHGTYASYDTLGCRCAVCRRASADYRAELRTRARGQANG